MRAERVDSATLPRKRVILREQIARESDAPRYFGLRKLSELSGFDTRTLARWLHNGTVWIPTPTVLLGEQERPGWELDILRDWKPGLTGVERLKPVQYLSMHQMRRRYGMTEELLLVCVAEDHSLSMPAMWLDGKPGWVTPG